MKDIGKNLFTIPGAKFFPFHVYIYIDQIIHVLLFIYAWFFDHFYYSYHFSKEKINYKLIFIIREKFSSGILTLKKFLILEIKNKF